MTDQLLDARVDRALLLLRGVNPRLAPTTHAAILARVMGSPAATAVPELAPRPSTRRRAAVAAIVLAAVAAIGVAIWWSVPAPTESIPGGQIGAPVPPAPRRTVAPLPRTVSPGELEPDRIAGDKMIEPDADTRNAMLRDKVSSVIGTIAFCVDVQGRVHDLALAKSSGYTAYDRALVTGVSAWAYRSRADEVCTKVSFIYAN